MFINVLIVEKNKNKHTHNPIINHLAVCIIFFGVTFAFLNFQEEISYNSIDKSVYISVRDLSFK